MANRARSSETGISKRSLVLALSSIFCGASAWAATGDGSLTDSNITYVGRWDKSSTTTYRSYWDGAYLSTKFTGTTVKVKLAASTNFKYIIDGKLTTYTGSSGTVDLTPTPLANGTHTLKVIAPFNDAELPFQGLVLDAGASTLPADARPLVEFIGDSITAGHSTTDWAVTDYAWLTGERLGAEHTQIAYSGITLADGYHYSSNQWPGMESAYFKLQPVNHCHDVACTTVPAWNFSNYTAKLVVVNLGTNDSFLGDGRTPPASFQSRYTAFLQNIRAKYPATEIFVLRTFVGAYVAETQAAVNARVSAGDDKVHFIDTTGWLEAPADYVDWVHPTDAGHVKITNRLFPILQPYLSQATVNDTQFSFDNTSNWSSGGQAGAYQGDNHWSGVTNASYQVPFSGTQIKLYGGRAAWHGIAAVSVDGGGDTNVDTYAAARADGSLLWTSPVLAAGAHTLNVRVTGMKNPSSSGSYLTADRVDIVNGGLNLLKNPGFENGLNGWGVWPAGAPAYTDVSAPRSGTSYLANWSANPYYVATYQTISGLSNGLYTVKAWVQGSGGQQLYVKNFGGAQRTAILPSTNAYTEVVISNVNVTNGYAEVGFWSDDAAGGKWFIADDVSFYRQ